MWKNKFNNLEPITNKFDQEFIGDYYGEINDPNNEFDGWRTTIEVKGIEPEHPLNSTDALFLEVWSCRETNNEGWIYKQTKTEFLIYRNNTGTYFVDYPKLRKWWYNIYPNPRIYKNREYNAKMYIANNYPFSFNKVQGTTNESEGYWVPTKWLQQNNFIL